MTKILGISGSLRRGSYNSALLRAATRLMPEGAVLESATIRGIPLYDGDVEAQGIPVAVSQLKEAIIAADVVLFASAEFGFLTMSEAFTTGSSIMPQKRNPDVFELMRGRGATAQACLLEALAVCAKLPSGYHRDLQLLKFPLFRGIDLALETLALLPAAAGALTFHPERIRLDDSIHAAEEANRLVVAEGIPFREAYRRVAARLRR